jgi:putative membrane protein
MKRIFPALCCFALCYAPAFAQHHHAARAGAAAAMPDQQFINMAAQTDMLEAHLGQMAANQASRQEVKDYAQMLVSDHTADYQQLGSVGGKDGLTVPGGLDADHWKMVVPFEKLNGAPFDERYIRTMIEGHTKAVALYTKEAADAQDPDVKAYASATLPTLQKHLEGAKNLLKKK